MFDEVLAFQMFNKKGGSPQCGGGQDRPSYMGIPLDPINMILPNSQEGALFVGDVDSACDLDMLRQLNIRAVLTVAPDLKVSYPKSEQIAHKVLPAVDEDDYDLSQHFEEASAFIDRNRSKTNVLVHCQAGVSRSTTIVIAYLMWKFGWNTSQAYSTVKSGRRLTCPNFGFCRQLKAYEKLLFGESDKQVSSASTIDDSCYRKDPPRSSRYLRDNADCSKSTIATQRDSRQVVYRERSKTPVDRVGCRLRQQGRASRMFSRQALEPACSRRHFSPNYRRRLKSRIRHQRFSPTRFSPLRQGTIMRKSEFQSRIWKLQQYG